MVAALKVGIAGLGTVGAEVVRQIDAQSRLLAARCGRSIRVVAVTARSQSKKRDLDLRGVASLVGPADAADGVALPFLVHGSWDNPRLSPDGPALLRRSEDESWDRVIRAAALSWR